MKVLFVCLGNICRSPVAEGIFRQLSERESLPIHLDSAGIIDTHRGENPDPRSIANARRNGVDISQLVSRPITESDLLEFDQIFVMDKKNLEALGKFRNYAQASHKIVLTGHYINPTSPPNIPDPYYGTEKDFQQVFDLLHRAAEAWKRQHFS